MEKKLRLCSYPITQEESYDIIFTLETITEEAFFFINAFINAPLIRKDTVLVVGTIRVQMKVSDAMDKKKKTNAVN